MTIYDYMLPAYHRINGEQFHITDGDVVSPPALFIESENGDVWTLGVREYFQHAPFAQRGGEFIYNVLRNGVEIGEWACRIERRGGRVRIFTPQGWKRFNGREFI